MSQYKLNMSHNGSYNAKKSKKYPRYFEEPSTNNVNQKDDIAVYKELLHCITGKNPNTTTNTISGYRIPKKQPSETVPEVPEYIPLNPKKKSMSHSSSVSASIVFGNHNNHVQCNNTQIVPYHNHFSIPSGARIDRVSGCYFVSPFCPYIHNGQTKCPSLKKGLNCDDVFCGFFHYSGVCRKMSETFCDKLPPKYKEILASIESTKILEEEYNRKKAEALREAQIRQEKRIATMTQSVQPQSVQVQSTVSTHSIGNHDQRERRERRKNNRNDYDDRYYGRYNDRYNDRHNDRYYDRYNDRRGRRYDDYYDRRGPRERSRSRTRDYYY